mmetsp:Transcript_5041/g.8566  ORF Transcript_5041/g.8566 Transcript_5041/m.8566 type:complete len:249 (+) Transcript_5041:334-1080(+)
MLCQFLFSFFPFSYMRSQTKYLRGKKVHDGDRSGQRLPSEETGHGNHGGTAVLELHNLVAGLLLGGQTGLEAPGVEPEVAGLVLGGLVAPVVAGVADGLALGDGDEGQDGAEARGVLGGPHAKGLGPVGRDGGAGEVHAEAEAGGGRGPNARPGQHGHPAVLDLGLLQELRAGEHVGEGVGGVLEGGQAERVPRLSADLLETSGGRERSLGGRVGRRGKCGSGAHEGGKGGGGLHLAIICMYGNWYGK